MARRRFVEVDEPSSDPEDDPAGERGGTGRFAGRPAGEILRGLWRPKGVREPLVATREVVNGLTKQEFLAGGVATLVAAALSVILYIDDHGYPGKTASDIAVRHNAPTVLIVGLAGAAILALGTGLRRRALLGFAALLTGLALGTIGIVFIAFGAWLIFRVLKKQRLDRQGSGAAPPARGAWGARGARGARAGRGPAAKAASAAPRKPPASKRYTPPRGASAGARKR